MFNHTSSEKGMWRGWIKNGQSLEITWPRTDVGIRVGTHGRSRHLWIGTGLVQAFVPIGIHRVEHEAFDGPEYGFSFSKEFGIRFSWNRRSKHFEWPFHRFTKHYEELSVDGEWCDVMYRFDAEPYEPLKEVHSYTYTLRSGKVQNVTATITQRRHIIARHLLHRIGWPKKEKLSIDVDFDSEIGERTGSWKGGAVGCGYDMKKGETMLDTLRRMERERTF